MNTIMLRSVVQRFLCRRYALLLAAYSEGGLNAAARARVAAHLEACPNCRAEFAELEAVSALLRTNIPTPAAPAANLWSKLEARIQAEAPRPHLAPDAPLLPAPRFAWNVFGRSFASAGAVVGVGVACALVVMQKGLESFPLSNPTPTVSAAASPAAPKTVTIALIPKETKFEVRSAKFDEGKRKNSSTAFAEARSPKPEARLKLDLSVHVAAISPVVQPSRPIHLEIRRGKPSVGTLTRYAVNDARRRETEALGYVEPREPQDAALTKAFDTTESETVASVAERPNTIFAYVEALALAASDAPVAAARVPLRQVAWVPDAELEARAVPASASAADALIQERQRQTLFSYTR